MDYDHTQRGKFVWPTVGLCAAVLVTLLVSGSLSAGWWIFTAALMVTLLVGLTIFNRMRVTVTGGRLVAAFGSGRPHREVNLVEARAVRQVRNRWWYGWGIRWIPGGSMYNVWGLDAVEFEFENGKIFRVGTDQPEKLLAAVSSEVG